MGVKGLIAVDVTVHVIQSSTDHQERLPWRDFLLPSMLKPLLISIGLMVFQQFSGVNAVIFNAASIFSNAGFSDAKLISITVGAVQFIGAGLGCLLMDKAGRRKILLMTGLVMCICHVVLGVYFEIYIPPTEKTPQADTLALFGSIHRSVQAKRISSLSITSLVVFNMFYALGWGPVAWLIMSEIFPQRARGQAGGIATLINWTCSFIVTQTYQSMADTLSIQGAYWFYAGCCFFAFIFVYFFLPETKGRTLEEMEAMFDQDKQDYERIS